MQTCADPIGTHASVVERIVEVYEELKAARALIFVKSKSWMKEVPNNCQLEDGTNKGLVQWVGLDRESTWEPRSGLRIHPRFWEAGVSGNAWDEDWGSGSYLRYVFSLNSGMV